MLLTKQCSSDLEVQISVSKVTAVFIYLLFMEGIILVAVSSCSDLHITVVFDLYWRDEGSVVALKPGDVYVKFWWGT